jgi:hypothetical protein
LTGLTLRWNEGNLPVGGCLRKSPNLPPLFVEDRLIVQVRNLVENCTINTPPETKTVIAKTIAGAKHD